MKKEIDYLLDNGLAEPNNSPWALLLLPVSNPDGTNRLCTDYNTYSFPVIEDLVDDRVIYNNQNLYTENVLLILIYIASVTLFGLYAYRVMPLRMCRAPATFQRTISLKIS